MTTSQQYNQNYEFQINCSYGPLQLQANPLIRSLCLLFQRNKYSLPLPLINARCPLRRSNSALARGIYKSAHDSGTRLPIIENRCRPPVTRSRLLSVKPNLSLSPLFSEVRITRNAFQVRPVALNFTRIHACILCCTSSLNSTPPPFFGFSRSNFDDRIS